MRARRRGLTGCAFACHEKEGGQTISNYDVAKQNGILTRVDVLRQAACRHHWVPPWSAPEIP